jgi:2-isopropylmalate synthase
MLERPSEKYIAFPPINMMDRRWPNRMIMKPPIWMSTDLRDGNQAIFEPMNAERKLRMFRMLCAIGFKEIEVAFPSASQTDFDFVRSLINDNHIPDDVTIEVLTQAREHLIARTMESLKGARRAIVHIYNATSKPFRDIVFGMSKAQIIDMVIASVEQVKQLASEQPQTEFVLEYSPETFSSTELEFSLEICNAVTEIWGATPQNQVILNLPATVEAATPNIYADQVEWMHTHLDKRGSVILSLHPHNDRGTAVAAAELALMAGGQRVEGCLFGNGERTGNVDIITLALNLYTQGISPALDFSDIDAVMRTAEYCTKLPVHPRHPYAGELVFTAFSGSHQDAIKKGLAAQKPGALWNVPYLPIDPADLQRSYESVIRINSQSGKGGVAYILETECGIILPRRLQIEFSQVVQAYADKHGSEISPAGIKELFKDTYLEPAYELEYKNHELFTQDNEQGIRLSIIHEGRTHELSGVGNGPLDAAVNALATLDIYVKILKYEERSLEASHNGGEAQASAFIEAAHRHEKSGKYGVGIDGNIVTASIKALVNAVASSKK